MSFYQINAYVLPQNQPITLSISFSFNLFMLQNSKLVDSSPIDDTLEVCLKAFKSNKTILNLRFFSSQSYDVFFSEEESCKEVHELLSDLKLKQRKLLEASILDLTIEKTQVFKYNSKSGKRVTKHLNLSQDLEEIQWSNSNDSIKYSCVKLRDIIDFTIGPYSSNFQRILADNPMEIHEFYCCFSVTTHEKSLDIRIKDENQARIWITGLKRVLKSQGITKIPFKYHINQPFSFQKFLNILKQKSFESGISIKTLVIESLMKKNRVKTEKPEQISTDRSMKTRNSVNKLKYLSLGNISRRNTQNYKTLKSIESYINPLNEETKNEKIPLRRSHTERNFLAKPHNSLPRNMKTSHCEDKENQDVNNYKQDTSMNLYKKHQKTKIKLSFDKSSLKQKVWAMIKENQQNRSFITNNESFSKNYLTHLREKQDCKQMEQEPNRNSIDNLTIEIANIDIISPKKKSDRLNFTGVDQDEFNDLNKRYKKLLDEYLVQSKDNEKLMQKILDLNKALREKNEEIHELKYKPVCKQSPHNVNNNSSAQVINQSLPKTQEQQFQKEIVQLKSENMKLKATLSQQKPANILLRKPSLNISDRTFEIKGPSYNNVSHAGNFKDLLIKNQKLFEENSSLKNEIKQLKATTNENVYKKMLNLLKQLQMVKIDFMELKMMQQEDLEKFKDLWPHLFKIFEFQQQKMLKHEAKMLTLDKENKVLMFQMKSNIHH